MIDSVIHNGGAVEDRCTDNDDVIECSLCCSEHINHVVGISQTIMDKE